MKHENMIKFRVNQLISLALFGFAWIVSLFYKKNAPLWLITERGVDARDNGYWFFLYMKKNHPELNVCYIITHDSPDRKRLLQYEKDLVKYRSFSHYIMLWRATHLISTHVQGYFPYAGLGLWLKKHLSLYNRKVHVGIKHGITKDHMAYLDYTNTELDMIVAGVTPEYEYFKTAYLYPSDKVKLTGFCRFDNLCESTPKKQILVMPTWREWIYKKDNFLQTEYAQKYIELLTDSRILQLLEKYDYTLLFYPHHEIQRYVQQFKDLAESERVTVADSSHYDVQELLKESKLLITDYSSVYFDFAYMRKPIIFYQFDYIRYRQEHYREGWYDYENGLGPVPKTLVDFVDCLSSQLEQNCLMKDCFVEKVEKYFPYTDRNNCKRVYEAIMQIKK